MKRSVVLMIAAFLFAGVLVCGSSWAAAKKVTMNLGWATPMEHNYGRLSQKFKELVEQYTDGTVEVKLFCCGQLGTEDGAFKSMQLGTVDGFIYSPEGKHSDVEEGQKWAL
jgi:TRAP-type C4-dicarboxylate transport system substrate-binding protein